MIEADRVIRERDQWITRHLSCPDSFDRLITMPMWYWNCFEWLQDNGFCQLNEVLSLVIKITRECGSDNFETRFQANLQGYLWEFTRFLYPMLNVGNPHNDNIESA